MKKYVIYDSNDYIEDEDDFAARVDFENLYRQFNLSIPIIAIADMGLWQGRTQGYKTYANLRDILITNDNYYDVKWYFDGRDLKGILKHHDGTHKVTYRVIRDIDDFDDIDYFINKIYEGEEITQEEMDFHSESLKDILEEIFEGE